jgi:two-component sensor histidine kinase
MKSTKPGSNFFGFLQNTTIVATACMVAVSVMLFFASLAIEDTADQSQEVIHDHLPILWLTRIAIQEELISTLRLWNATEAAGKEARKKHFDESNSHTELAAKALSDLERLISTEEGRRLHELTIRRRSELHDAKRTFILELEPANTAASPNAASQNNATVLRNTVLAYSAAIVDQQKLQIQLVSNVTTTLKSDAIRTQYLLVSSWALLGAALIWLGLLWKRQIRQEIDTRDSRLAAVIENRDTLVREVHHRIKNHLQGVVSMIETQQLLHPELDGKLVALHGHVLALAGVHGLQGQRCGTVQLGDLISQQVGLLKQGFGGKNIEISIISPCAGCGLHDEHAVPFALIVTELLTNAMKHGNGDVALTLKKEKSSCSLTVSNSAHNPLTPDFENEEALGTGLGLVKTLSTGLGTLKASTRPDRFLITLYFQSSTCQRRTGNEILT